MINQERRVQQRKRGIEDVQDEICVPRQTAEPMRGENHGLVSP